MNYKFLILLFTAFFINGSQMNKFSLISDSFENNQNIPAEFTCVSENVSPHLKWSNIPDGTKSFVLVVDDPDAQTVVGKTFVHWIVTNIPSSVNEFIENGNINGTEIQNDKGQIKYYGPCPPNGEHRYYFTLFALNKEIDTSNLNTDFFRDSYNQTSEFYKQNKDHILGFAQLMGKFSK